MEEETNEEKLQFKPAEADETGGLKEEGLTEAELAELKDRHLRLYAEFENYKKRVNKEREELVKYGNESLFYELLPIIDNLEMALKHSADNTSEGLVKGVEITLREFQRTIEKFGLMPIPATGRPFDPAVHHAMSQVERPDIEEGIVADELRKGYMFRERVLRPSMVTVSKKAETKNQQENNIKIEIREE